MLKNMLNLLITGVGGPTPRSFARALKKYGNYKNYRLFGTDINRYAIGLYQNDIFEKCFITPKSGSNEYWSVIEQIIEQYNIHQAVILPEMEAYAWSIRQANESLPCHALIPEQHAAQIMLDKSSLTELLINYDLAPKSVTFNYNDDFSLLREIISNKIGLPLWVRSATGSSGLGSFKINSFPNLQHWIAINPGIGKFIASEFLSGRNLACKLLYFNGMLVRAACAERVSYIMAKTAPSGITGNTSFGRLINDQKVFEHARRATEIVLEETKSRKHGFFTVDLKEDNSGNPYVTEINIRHVAFTSAFAAAGANFCEDTVRLLDFDDSFDSQFHLYAFEPGTIFLREVDTDPIVLNEKNLLHA